jgi:hypothetical protein
MGLLLVLALAAVGWLWWTDRLDGRTLNRILAAALALVAVRLGFGGSVIGGLVAGGAAVAWWLVSERAATREERELADARATLGVGPDADAEAIRAAHRRLAGLEHPDRGGSHVRMVALNAARDRLLRALKAK